MASAMRGSHGSLARASTLVHVLPPHPNLAECVAWYWAVDAASDGAVDLRVDVYVDARADLVFNFGAPYHRTRFGETRTVVADANFDAQRTTPIAIEQRGAVSVAGVRFHAGGVAPFTDVWLAELTDLVVPVDTVFGMEALELERALRAAAGDLEQQRGLFDAFLLGRRRRDRSRTTFASILAHLVASGTDATVASAAAAGGVSARHATRLFRRHLGLPPRTMRSIARFQRALDAMAAAPDGTVAAIAASCGYADQAHLVREVRRFAGGPAKSFRGYFPPEAPKAFAPNVVRFVQDAQGRNP